MKRDEFEHAIRAAGSILGNNRLLVIGTQALHASVRSKLPAAAQRSIEVDIAVFGDRDGAKADLIDGSIGEGSMFHETFGYYAQGVTEATAVLPRGWRKRLIPFETPATGGVVAYCLEPHDLWIAKAIANRDQDIEFCDELLRDNLVDRKLLDSRLKSVANLDPRIKAIVLARIAPSRA
jgi:uncharacterized nucleotidyltransferase DUF6036